MPRAAAAALGVAVALVGVGLSGPAVAKPDAGGAAPIPAAAGASAKTAPSASGASAKTAPGASSDNGPSGAGKATPGKVATRSGSGSGSPATAPVKGWAKAMKEPAAAASSAPAASNSPAAPAASGTAGLQRGHVEATPSAGASEPAGDAPVITNVAEGDESLTVTWSDPANGAPDSYEVLFNGINPANCQGGNVVSPCVITTGISNGTTLKIEVVAHYDQSGATATSTAWYATPHAQAPSAPAVPTVTAAARNDLISVNWASTGDGGAEILGYEVTVAEINSGDTVTCAGTPSQAGPNLLAGTSCTATGIPGTSYRVSVRAVNTIGPSPAGEQVVAVVPAAPLVQTLNTGNLIGVHWDPAGPNPETILGYEVTVARSDDPSQTLPCVGTPASIPGLLLGSPCTATGEYGASYNVSVTAHNDAGISDPGTTVDNVLVVEPGAPAVSASASGSTVTVGWTPPDIDGGAAIDGYQVTVTVTGTSTPVPCTGTPAPPSAPAGLLVGTSCTVAGQPGTSYAVAVMAHNSVGYSAAGAATATVLATVPEAPEVWATADGTTIHVEWSYLGTGGAELTGYEVTVTLAGTATTVPCTPVIPSVPMLPTSCTAAGEPGTTYDVTVKAVNSEGPSAPGTASVTIAAVPPAAPTVEVSTSGGTITVTWTPNGTGGAAIDGYEVTVQRTGTSETLTCGAPAGSPPLLTGTTCTAPGAMPGASYTVTVFAHNSAGLSAAGTATVTVGALPPAAPTVTASTSGSTITVTWAPGSTGGAAIHGYYVAVERNSGPGADDPGCVGATTGTGNDLLYTGTSCTMAGVPGATYIVQVTARNSAGESEAGQTTATVADVPAPAGLTVTPGDASATVAWTAVTGYPAVTGYTVTYAVENGSPATSIVSGVSATGTTLSGLQNVTTYSVTVSANIGTGLVTASEALLVTPTAPVQVPDTVPPTNGNLNLPSADTTPAPGDQMIITGSGYAPNSLVKVVIYSNPIPLGEVLTDQNGSFSLAVSVPSSLLGSHTITSIGFDSNGQPHVLTLPVTVTAAGSGPGSGGGSGGGGLAITGAPVMAILAFGVVLVVVGAVSRFAGARRRR